MPALNIALAQMNPMVGDIEGNVEQILALSQGLIDAHKADLIVFPELTLTGYPPEDLLLRPSLESRIQRALTRLKTANLSAALVIGYPLRDGAKLLNMAGVIAEGNVVFEYAKRCLPNYQVFDEKRYFAEGSDTGVFRFKGYKIALSVCEDIWDGSPIEELSRETVDLLLNLNASPFHKNKQKAREALVSDRAKRISAPIFYVNQVGGQDELVFDGGSMVVDSRGDIVARSPLLKESNLVVSFDKTGNPALAHKFGAEEGRVASELSVIYDALVLGVRDYVNKNGFKGVVLGLSGGIDSALTLAIAVDALGAHRVEAVMMPFRYTSQMSKDDAAEEADLLGVKYRSIGIEPIYEAFIDALSDAFSDSMKDKTEENIQARSRGVLLMALSNKLGYLVLTTGNKSEMAVGYATLYGDMAGGLDVLKDVPKVTVFELAKYRNTRGYVIPENVITRPPSAELAPDQIDEDSLPPYEVLDQILECYVERDMSAASIIELGFDPEEVKRVLRMVDLNEYKRRQAPVGIRISERAFGRDRRYPITNGWKIGD